MTTLTFRAGPNKNRPNFYGAEFMPYLRARIYPPSRKGPRLYVLHFTHVYGICRTLLAKPKIAAPAVRNSQAAAGSGTA